MRRVLRAAGFLLLAFVVVLLWKRLRPGWEAGASVYSGKPDPTWTVPRAAAAELERSWQSLPLAPRDTQPAAPGLGYRGCWLRDPGGREWRAYAGLVELTAAGREFRKDPGRVFELRLLATAPPGILPREIVIPSEARDLARR